MADNRGTDLLLLERSTKASGFLAEHVLMAQMRCPFSSRSQNSIPLLKPQAGASQGCYPPGSLQHIAEGLGRPSGKQLESTAFCHWTTPARPVTESVGGRWGVLHCAIGPSHVQPDRDLSGALMGALYCRVYVEESMVRPYAEQYKPCPNQADGCRSSPAVAHLTVKSLEVIKAIGATEASFHPC